ncbi:hypothetical protein WN943_016246 [Citrus x changshan-huyou]
MDPQSRCCPEKGEKFSCQGCNLLSQCCNSYEYCVSCCVNPARTLKEQVLNVKIAKPTTAGKFLLWGLHNSAFSSEGTYGSVFDFCAGRCRHNSESVVHENAYLSDFHHCFSMPSNASGAGVTQLEGRLSGISVIIGSIQKYMSCKRGCLASMGADQPAEVADDAPSNLHACTREYNQCSLVMVLIGIPGDFAPVHNTMLVETIGIWSRVPGAWDHSVYPELVPIVISNLIHGDGNVAKLKYFCYAVPLSIEPIGILRDCYMEEGSVQKGDDTIQPLSIGNRFAAQPGGEGIIASLHKSKLIQGLYISLS